VAEEAQLSSCWPKSNESVAMHEPAHCHGGGTSCFSITECFSHEIFSWMFQHFRENTSDSLFSLT
jgi:hypothetical protein